MEQEELRSAFERYCNSIRTSCVCVSLLGIESYSDFTSSSAQGVIGLGTEVLVAHAKLSKSTTTIFIMPFGAM